MIEIYLILIVTQTATGEMRAGLRVEQDSVVGEVEFETLVGSDARNGSHAEGRLPLADGEREQLPPVLQPQDRHVHLPIVAEVADAIEGLLAVAG